jgi:hypothetical protein
MICPWFGDQPFWGRSVNKLGAGPAPIPHRRLTAERLAAAVNSAVNDLMIRPRAMEIGRKIRNEDGAATAVNLVAPASRWIVLAATPLRPASLGRTWPQARTACIAKPVQILATGAAAFDPIAILRLNVSMLSSTTSADLQPDEQQQMADPNH